jgi:hypothetical protein
MKYEKHMVRIINTIIDYCSDKPELADDIVRFFPKADEKMMRDIFNIY